MTMTMTINKAIKVFFTTTAFAAGIMSLNVYADGPQGGGQIDFTGKIIDAPCTVAPESTEIPVNMGQVSSKILANGGNSQTETFEIKLLDCPTDRQHSVKIKFGGTANAIESTLFGLLGSAKGAGIALVDSSGKQIAPEEMSNVSSLSGGTNVLRFGAYLKGTPGASNNVAVVPGDFNTVVNFSLMYD